MPKNKPAAQLAETTDTSSKLTGRSRKGAFPPEGIRVSRSFGNALLAAGAKDKSQRLPAPATTALFSKTSNSNSTAAACASKPETNVIDLTNSHDAAAAASGSQKKSFDKPPPLATADGDRSHPIQGNDSKENSSSSLSINGPISSSVDSVDDPDDGDYGTRTSNGKGIATNTRKEPGTTRKYPTVPTKRGSSITTATERAEKRSRYNL